MSADNWAICPRCKAKRDAELIAGEVLVGQQYGKIAPEEWDKLRAEVDALRKRIANPPSEDYRFREDYEVGVYSTGTFEVSYAGECRDCHLKKNFQHTETLNLEEPTA